MLGVAEITLEEGDVGQVHRKAALVDESLEPRFVELGEALDDLDLARHGVIHLQGFALIERSLARLDGIDDVMLDGVHIRLAQRALKHVEGRRKDVGALALADELDALGGRGSALVELTWQELDGEQVGVADFRQLIGNVVRLGLAENRGDALLEQLIVDTLDVVAVDQAQTG